MPIKPENRARYPKDWKKISKRIREERAQGRCECFGECGDHQCSSPAHQRRCSARNGQEHPVTGSIVVLTVAHLDHTPENVDDANLKAMCQRCHLRYDRFHHATNARKTRDAKTGQEAMDI
ncbi:hypothetical protein [Sphingobium yanoikuyae]|uniref:hypothetical protein n=1 Tax=Sphingobium yanoikuyae TaxID=13690 RepID=UPI0035C76737